MISYKAKDSINKTYYRTISFIILSLHQHY